LHIVLSFVVYNYPILSLDKEIVKYYIKLGIGVSRERSQNALVLSEGQVPSTLFRVFRLDLSGLKELGVRN